MAESETQKLPSRGNYHRAKRDLLRRAVRSGRVRMSEIKRTLPPPHISVAELELFLFSLGALGVDVIEDLKREEGGQARRIPQAEQASQSGHDAEGSSGES